MLTEFFFYRNVHITNEIVCRKHGAMGAQIKIGDNFTIGILMKLKWSRLGLDCAKIRFGAHPWL
jgi:hypothetical protein